MHDGWQRQTAKQESSILYQLGLGLLSILVGMEGLWDNF